MEQDLPKKILQKIRNNMEKEQFDVLFLMKEPNIRYVSGLLISIYSRPIAVVIPLDDSPIFIAPAVETVDFERAPPYTYDQRLSRSIWIEDIRTWYEHEAFPGAISDPFQYYNMILNELNLKVKELVNKCNDICNSDIFPKEDTIVLRNLISKINSSTSNTNK